MSASQDASVEYNQLNIKICDFFPLGAFGCFLTLLEQQVIGDDGVVVLLSEGLDCNGPLVHDVGDRAEQGVQLGEVVCVPVVSSQEVVCTITSRTQQLDCSSGLAYDQHGESGVPGQRRHPRDAHQLQDGLAPPPHGVDDVQHRPEGGELFSIVGDD